MKQQLIGFTKVFINLIIIRLTSFQMDSIFQLRRPYDFLALAQQEQRAMQVESLKRELVSQKSQIDRNEDKVSNFSSFYLGCVHFYFLHYVFYRYQAQWNKIWCIAFLSHEVKIMCCRGPVYTEVSYNLTVTSFLLCRNLFWLEIQHETLFGTQRGGLTVAS